MKDIDTTDYALLSCIADAATPIWKKRLHDQLQHRDPPLPGDPNISLQTVSRRINAMHEHGLLDTEIVHPPDISQNLIIGYRLTDMGRQVLDEKRGDILSTYAAKADHESTEDIDHNTLLNLFDDELDLTAEEYATLEQSDVEELYVFALMYHTHRHMTSTLDKQTAEAFYRIIRRASKGNDSSQPITYPHSDCHG